MTMGEKLWRICITAIVVGGFTGIAGKADRIMDRLQGESPPDFVVLKWSDVPNEYTVFRPAGFDDAAFAAWVLRQEEIMHRTFLAMKGR